MATQLPPVPPPPDPSVQRFTPDGRPTEAQVSYEKRLSVYLGSLRQPPSAAVGDFPAGSNGALGFATNGRKAGEGAGAGTGVMVAYSNGAWRRLSDDAAVTA